ncbi:MAG TPA: hypothetical protein VKV24_09095 [Casimicrobiaceae bacterium]|nr:hypothetical protein [Casimicrobiaceae bacterium]
MEKLDDLVPGIRGCHRIGLDRMTGVGAHASLRVEGVGGSRIDSEHELTGLIFRGDAFSKSPADFGFCPFIGIADEY